MTTTDYLDDDMFPPSMKVSVHNLYQLPFLFLQDHRKDYKTLADTAIHGIHQKNELNYYFFSRENIKRVHKLLREAVLAKTGNRVIIEDQDESDLLVVMRAVYFEYGRNLDCDIRRQIDELDFIVVRETIPGIMSNVKQYLGYIRDITLPLNVPDRPLNVSAAGRRTLPSVTSLF